MAKVNLSIIEVNGKIQAAASMDFEDTSIIYAIETASKAHFWVKNPDYHKSDNPLAKQVNEYVHDDTLANLIIAITTLATLSITMKNGVVQAAQAVGFNKALPLRAWEVATKAMFSWTNPFYDANENPLVDRENVWREDDTLANFRIAINA